VSEVALEQFRSVWENLTAKRAEKMTWLSPAFVTWLTLPIGLCAAWLMMTAGRDSTGGWLLLGSAALVGIAQLLDGFDGTLARATGRVTRWGDLLDHTLDRVLDIVWLVAIGMNSVWVGDASIGWAAALFTMFGSYMGTQAQAVTGRRDYSGFSRADRLVITIIGLTAAGIMALTGTPDFGWYLPPLSNVAINPLTLIIVISGVGGAYTFIRRFIQARSHVNELDKNEPLSVTPDTEITDAGTE
jgi:phosphatidylglycerophosphate synthase